MSLRAFVRELADALADRLDGKRVGDLAEGLMARIGFDEWFGDFVLGWARTGEPGSFFEFAGGRVWVQELGLGEHKVPTVWMLVTPMSDPAGLLDEARRTCEQVLPAETFSRYAWSVRAHEIVSLEASGMGWDEIARTLLDRDEPHWRQVAASDQATYLRSAKERYQKLAERFRKDYWDSFSERLSPDSCD